MSGESSQEGLIPLQSGMVPNNLNPRGWVTNNFYIKGAPQTFASLDDIIAFHPFKMNSGMSATVINHPELGNVSSFRLIKDPNLLTDDDKESLVVKGVATEGTAEITFTEVWELVETVQSTAVSTYMYAPDGPGGGAPIYPYTPSSETTAGWEPIFNANKAHRWMRIRSDSVDEAPADGVFDNWTQPIRVSDSFTTGDYIENQFLRQVTDDTIHQNLDTVNTLTLNKYYSVLENTVVKTVNGQDLFFTLGYIFQYVTGAGISWSFTTSKLQETVAPPPRTIDGIPNNDPAGWQDTIPVGTDQLWQIWAQKSVYGQLKSDWRIKKISEDPDLIRYSNIADPHPDSIVSTTTPATTGSQGDLDLIAAGWDSTYNRQVFLATREEITPGSLWTTWTLQKIEEESGEFTDTVFKLFDLNLDHDDVALQPPVGRDAIAEGWSDSAVPEPVDGTQINYISITRKFFDGTLKTPWSTPVPNTGRDSWTDTVSSNIGDDFKYDKEGVVTPDEIILTSKLHKGIAQMWLSNTITYVWEIVFNNGLNGIQPGDPEATAGLEGAGGDFFYLLGNGAPVGDPTRIQDAQKVTIKPAAVDGKVVVRCTQTIEISAGNTIDFIEEFSILDITDGNDAKALVLNTDTYVMVYDSGSTSISPSTVQLRAYFSNLVNQTWQWWIDVGNTGTWVEISTRAGYTVSGTLLDFVTTVTNTDWSQDGTKHENRFAITNYDGDPDTPSTDPLDEEFRDIVTITKLSSAGVGSDGTSPTAIILYNGTHSVVLDTTTGEPQTGQVGINSPASTKVLFYEGTNLRVYDSGLGADEWVITSITVTALDQDGNVVNTDVVSGFSGVNGQSEAQAYVSSWVSQNFPVVTISAQLTINITYNGNSYSTIFTLGTSLDAPGAVILDIDSDKGFIFDINDRTNKILTGTIHDDTNNLSDADFYFNWYIENAWVGWGALGVATKTITHSNIRNSADVKCAISTNNASNPDTQAFRRRAVRFSDIQDGKIILFYNDAASKPVKPSGNGRDNSQLGTWYKSTDSYWNTHDAVWASDGNENATDGTWIWSEPYRIGAESGIQGENGGFEMSMYKKDSTTKRANPASIQGLKNDGWSATIPTPTAGSTIYIVKKFYKGEYLDEIVAFDGNHEPIWGAIKDDVDASTAAKSLGTWSTPKAFLVTPSQLPADDGVNGNNGWTPVYGIYTYGESRLLQLLDWIGGEGTKPGFINYYVRPSGLSGSPNHDGNIRGPEGPDGKADWWGGGSVREKVNATNVNVTAGIDLHSASIISISNPMAYERIAYIHSTGYTYNSNARHYIKILSNDSEIAKGMTISPTGQYANWAVSTMHVIPANTSKRIKITCNITVAGFSGRTHYEFLDL